MQPPAENDGSTGHQTHVAERRVSERARNQPGRPSLIRVTVERIQGFAGQMKLRSKFLLSLVLVIATMSGGTLLTVRQSMQAQVQRQVEEDARNSILTFQVMEQQRRLVLGRKAELLATLAYMRNGDPTVIRDVSQDPWQSEECDLFALVDSKDKITALQSRISDFPADVSSERIKDLVRDAGSRDWWVNGKQIYQVVVKRFFKDPPINSMPMGAVVVGREIDPARAKDLGRILSGEVVFQAAEGLRVSSLPAVEEQQIAAQLKIGDKPQEARFGERHFYTSSLNLLPGAHLNLNLIVLKSDEEALASLGRLHHMLVGLGLIVVLAGVILVYLISDTFTKPLGSLVEGVRALEEGDFSYPLTAAAGGDEVARVTRAFESMRDTLERNQEQREQLEEQLRQAQKMDALGRLAGGVAHDFNNLLTVIKGNSDLALERIKPTDAVRGNCEQIRRVADRAALLTRQLLAFSRRQMLQPKILDLNELIVEMGRLLQRLLREDIEYKVQLGEPLGRVQADPGQMEQVLLNLIVNASDAMPKGGTLTIETENVCVDARYAQSRPPLAPGDYVMLAVSDTGFGMDANIKARIFEPFFTTKEPGKGTGLGLATVYGVVKQSSGYIFVDSAPGAGARFEIYLPQATDKAEAAAAEERAAKLRGGQETVLLVEDEADVRTLTCEFLKAAGYQVLTAVDGKEGLDIGHKFAEQIDVLVTDVVMPRMRGPELAKRLKRLLPELKVVYMSGYTEEFSEGQSILEGASFLQKPLSRDALLRQIHDTLKGKPADQIERPAFSLRIN
jgi:signal transduction histidine kinase/ActR/RegA family two-component response regulator